MQGRRKRVKGSWRRKCYLHLQKDYYDTRRPSSRIEDKEEKEKNLEVEEEDQEKGEEG